MKIGYACIFLGDENLRQRTCTMKYVSEDKLREIISHNLNALQQILSYNVQHGILMYRLSSDMIPFGSSHINTLPWKDIYEKKFREIGSFIKQHGLRVSMHPGQYTILNAWDTEIVKRSIMDLEYHCSVLDLMGLDTTHKIILHIGGIYQDKELAIKRFIHTYQSLPIHIKKRLVIENDDRYYHIEDVLEISKKTQIPVVFDNLHHEILPPPSMKSIEEWLCEVHATWKSGDGTQKIHYSEQAIGKRKGAHAQYVRSEAFFQFLKQIPYDVDIMLEVKDKNLSASKIVYLLDINNPCFYEEWTYYQYLFYIHSLTNYIIYEDLFQLKKEIDRMVFYQLVESYLIEEVMNENYRMFFQFMKHQLQPCISSRSFSLLQRSIDSYQQHTSSKQQCVATIYRMAMREGLQEISQGLLLLKMLV